MKSMINSYTEITPSIFALDEFTEHENEIFGNTVLMEGDTLYIRENDGWTAKCKIHKSPTRTIHFDDKTRDLLIGMMHPEGFRVMKIQDYFDENAYKHPELVLEVFEEMIQEIHDMDDLDDLNDLLKSFNINLNTHKQ